MTKAIALIALSLTLEAAFLFQITVIARPEPRTAAPAAQLVRSSEQRAPVAQTAAPALPRS